MIIVGHNHSEKCLLESCEDGRQREENEMKATDPQSIMGHFLGVGLIFCAGQMYQHKLMPSFGDFTLQKVANSQTE